MVCRLTKSMCAASSNVCADTSDSREKAASEFHKKSLAEAVGVTPHAILRYEISENVPTQDVVNRIAKIIAFPSEFFFQSEIEGPNEAAASFRSMSAMSAKERDAALAAGAISFLLADWVEQRFDLPKPDLLDLSSDTPGVAARSLRERWGLGEQPIKNMVHLLESKGVRVFSMAENTVTVDAFSVWREYTPYIFLNLMKTAEHSRIRCGPRIRASGSTQAWWPEGTARRGTGKHVCFFVHDAGGRRAFEATSGPHARIRQLKAKSCWGVSVMALIHRLHRLQIMSPWQYPDVLHRCDRTWLQDR